MIAKLGSRGDVVKILQEFLEIKADGIFGRGTERAVKQYQSDNGLYPDGIVGPSTWGAMGIATTDISEQIFKTENNLTIEKHYLPKGEYKVGPTNKEYIFLHHTAGWHNPYNCIDQWGRDDRGAVATEFVLGGPSVKGNDNKYDGKIYDIEEQAKKLCEADFDLVPHQIFVKNFILNTYFLSMSDIQNLRGLY